MIITQRSVSGICGQDLPDLPVPGYGDLPCENDRRLLPIHRKVRQRYGLLPDPGHSVLYPAGPWPARPAGKDGTGQRHYGYPVRRSPVGPGGLHRDSDPDRFFLPGAF